MTQKHLIFFIFTLLVACKSNPEPNPNNPNLYGEELSSSPVTTFSDMMTQLDSQGEIEQVKVKATVEAVCQSKGCWMNLVSADVPDQSMFVQFKDYGFFVPMDIAGKEVVLEGKVYRETTSVEELRHYAEDEGKSKEEIAAIIKPVEELKFMATGVEIL